MALKKKKLHREKRSTWGTARLIFKSWTLTSTVLSKFWADTASKLSMEHHEPTHLQIQYYSRERMQIQPGLNLSFLKLSLIFLRSFSKLKKKRFSKTFVKRRERVSLYCHRTGVLEYLFSVRHTGKYWGILVCFPLAVTDIMINNKMGRKGFTSCYRW